MQMYDLPDASGHYGPYGGVFVSETLIHALDQLKDTYARCHKDPEFIAEAKKVMRFQPRFQIGEEGLKLYQQLTEVSPEIVTFLKDYIAEQKK